MKLPNRLAINTIYKGLNGLNDDQFNILNDSISASPQNVVKLDTKKILKESTDRTFSVRLMKWVEPYNIGGIEYSLFYTEVDHNLKVGDRVFIIGGYYDSDDILENSTDPYFAGVDGYRVLYVDRTKIVLDIEYVGIDPTNEEPIDNFIKVYVASTQYEFDYFLQALSMRDDNGNIESKFLEGYNNFLYLNGEFEINPGDYNGLLSFLLEDSTFPLIAGNGFFIRNSSDRLQEITTAVLTNTNISSLLNSGYNDPLSGFFNILKIRVMNGRFFAGSTEWKRDFIYYYNATHQKWMVDRSYTPTILTKSNFRGGLFRSGEFNQGLYGHYDERLDYDGTDIKWTLGTTLNVNWKAGTLGSDHYFKDSNFTVFDRTGLPQIRANAENNGGAGYNYVFDTDFEGGDVINGNIFNLSTFYGTMSSESALDNYYTGTQTTYSVTLSGGVYYNSDILFADISNVTLISSYVVNSIIRNSKAVNSEIVATAFLNSLYLGDNVIKIQAYEESNILWYDVDTALPPLDIGVNYKMYKFYVTESSFLRLRELQYFYFKDIIVNLPNTDLLNFFDDKFQIGHWTQTFDTIGQKQERQVLVQLSTKEENRNSPGVITAPITDLQPNFDNTLPSIDVFISGGEDFNFASASTYPRPFIAETVDITNAYILEGDFVSGLFKDSIWVSGNYINYNKDYHFEQVSGVYQGQSPFGFGPHEIDTTSNLLKIKTPLAFRPNIIGTQSYESNIVYINSVYYDSTLNPSDPGQNLVRMPDTFRILSADDVSTYRDFVLQDVSTQSTLSGFNSVSNGGPYFTSRQARNRYNYIHPVKFENSQIRSGLFRGAYFENCTFTNFDFDVLDKDLEKVIEKRNFLVSDVILDDNSNSINSGIFQYSHFLAGSDQWNSAIFHKGIWSESTFTYSFSPSFSTIFTREPSKFKNGVFRESEWQDGIFENGIFYKNRSNQAGDAGVFTDTIDVYYTDTLDTKWSWQRGTFENGDFEKSNFETGLFEDGNFFNSDFLTGEATGGNFGKKNIPFDRSRVWTGTFSNVNVINAEFRTEHPTGDYLTSSIVWNSGIFNSGIFGVQMDGSSPQYVPSTFQLSNTWYDGTFNGGDFTDVAEWKSGTFNGGRFRSFYWYEGQTPYELSLATGGSFSWQSGKFNNGEFGRADRATNSTWFSGEFNGGKFNGRYWRDGVFTRGNFEGHAASFSTDINNYNDFIASYTTEYYGYWQTGWVSEVKDKFLKDQKIWTEVVRESTKKRKRKTVEFKDMLWYSGTFSHTDGDMINSVWLDGSHQKGLFYESVFNPYINLALPIFIDGQLSQNWAITGSVSSGPNGSILVHNGATLTLSDVLQPDVEYTISLEVLENSLGNIQVTDGISNLVDLSYIGFTQSTFISQTGDIEIISTGTGTFSFYELVVYPGTVSGFRTTDSCIWENGKASSSDFYYSVWKNGSFTSFADSDQGNAWGLIFEDGISDYMNAYNVFWGKGIWRNGNWNGSPFTLRGTQSGYFIERGFASDIVNHISIYASQSGYEDWDSIHMNHTFTYSPPLEVMDDPELVNGLISASGNNWQASSLGLYLFYVPPYLFFGGWYLTSLSSLGYDNNVIFTSANDFLTPQNILDGTFLLSDPELTYTIEIQYYVTAGVYSSGGSVDVNLGIFIGDVFTPGVGISDVFTETFDLYPGTGQTFNPSQYYGTSGIKTKTYTYKPQQAFTDFRSQVNIRKINSNPSSDVTLHVMKISVRSSEPGYDDLTNNELWYPTGWQPSIGSTVSLPVTQYQFGDIYSKFGNGSFRSGIWENGVWNEGWRDDHTTLYADDLFVFPGGKNHAFRTERSVWTIKLSVLTGTQSPGNIDDINPGDRVSVGNIVAIDINEKRRLIRNYMTVVSKNIDPVQNVNDITLRFETTFPIRRIEKDSQEHIIHISKNVWLNGVFLNGKFLNGVWTNGLFQGFPYVTEMEDSQWIDGRFKGGAFRGFTASYLDSQNNSVEYHTGVIQKFVFSDENVSGLPRKFKYNSWIDVNYFEESGVNINKVNAAYKTTPLLFTASFIENNYYGYPTKDVLESVSTIRNGFDLNSRTYKLGWKFREYQDWIPYRDDQDQFIDINQLVYFNIDNNANDSLGNIGADSLPKGFGIQNLIDSGWTFSFGPVSNGFASGISTFGILNEINTNYGNLTPNRERKLIFKGGNDALGSGAIDDISNFTLDYIDNENVELERLRYSFVEITGESYNFTQSLSEINPIVFYNNYPATYSVVTRNIFFNNAQISVPINQVTSQNFNRQREYFFNKKGLEMTIFSGSSTTENGQYELGFDSVRVVETDMIPFFQFATDCIKRVDLVTWGQAEINWEDAGAAPSNGTIPVLDSAGVPIWNNFYLFDDSEANCESYINNDIQIPYIGHAPDINYGDINFSYITSTSIIDPNIGSQQ